jgi:hypothetical protein
MVLAETYEQALVFCSLLKAKSRGVLVLSSNAAVHSHRGRLSTAAAGCNLPPQQAKVEGFPPAPPGCWLAQHPHRHLALRWRQAPLGQPQQLPLLPATALPAGASLHVRHHVQSLTGCYVGSSTLRDEAYITVEEDWVSIMMCQTTQHMPHSMA